MMGDPPVVKVLAIMHLVFAGIGIMSAVWALLIAIVGNPFLKMMPHNPQMDAHLQTQMEMQQRIQPMSLTSGVLSLIVAVPMIIAGIRMLKKKRDGLKWSNRYAFISLGAKAVNLILTFTILLPAMRAMSAGMMPNSSMPGGMEDMMSGFMIGGTIGGVLLSCLYPILTLVLLNRPQVKEWFARQAD